MKLIGYELRKILGIRWLWIMLLVMAVLCAGMFYWRSGAADYDREYNATMWKLAEEYARDTSRFDAAKAAYDEYVNELNNLESQLMAEMGIFDPSELNDNTEFRDEYEKRADLITRDAYTLGCYPYSDDLILEKIGSYVSSGDGEGYRANCDRLLRNVRGVMRVYEISGAKDTPAYEYQEHFYNRMLGVREVDTGRFNPRGWDKLFGYREFGIFVFIYVILASGVVFLNESWCGTLSLIRISRRGRLHTVAAKLGATVIFDVFAVLIFSLSVFIPCAAIFGLSDGTLPIQTVYGMYCLFLMPIFGYALLRFAVVCLISVMISLVLALVTVLTVSPVITYVAGGAIFVSNLVMNFFISSSHWLSVNMIGMTTPELMQNYSEVYVFGHYYPTLYVGIAIYAAVAVIAGAAVIIVNQKNAPKVFVRRPSKLRELIPRLRGKSGAERTLRDEQSLRDEKSSLCGRTARKTRQYSNSLFAFECGKLMTPSVTAVLVLLIAASAIEANNTYGKIVYMGTAEYEAYVSERFFGECSDEMTGRIAERRKNLTALTSPERISDIRMKYKTGEITREEYNAAMNEIDSASIELQRLDDVNDEARRLGDAAAGTNVRGWLIPQTMISRILGRDINVFLAVAIIFVFSRVYANDYAGKSSEGNFASILRTTRRGRRASWRAKTLSAVVLALGITASFEAVDLIIGIARTDRFFDMLGAPMLSIEGYEVFGGLTLGGYILLMLALRFAAVLILTLLMLSASFAIKRVPGVLFAASAVTLLPYALVYMGVSRLKYIDLTAALSGGKLLTRSAEFAVSGEIYGFAIVFLAAYALISAAAVLYVRQRTGK